MFSEDFLELFLQVIKSWQVIAVTVTLVIYIFLVNYVARTHRRPRFVSKSKPKKVKAAAVEKTTPKEEHEDDNINDTLGLEEA